MSVLAEPEIRRVSARAFNRAVERTRVTVEARELAAMEAIYERLIRKAGREASLSLRAQSLTAAADWQPPPQGTLFDEREQTARAKAALTKSHRRVVSQMADGTLVRFGIAFDLAHPLSEALLEEAAQRTGEAFDEAVQFELRQIVADAYERGLAVDDAAALITEHIDGTSVWQARMLARTDLNGLSNGASVMSARLVGIATKSWLTADDERVREEHMAANGQTVPVDQPFQVCGEALQYPGDPAGSNGCVCNCRCSVIYDEPVADSVTASAREDTMSTTEAPTTVAWVSDLAFEGAATDDGRYMLPGAIEWRELPLSLMAMTETGPGGHEGAFLAGRIDSIERDTEFDMDGDPLPKGVIAIRARGVFDLGGENGAEVARIVGESLVRGVSVDAGAVEAVLRDPDTGDTFEPRDATPELVERAMFGELQTAFKRYQIAAATVCPTPAFADARIVITASGARRHRPSLWALLEVEAGAVTAAARLASPKSPPRDWFLTQELPGPTPLTITSEGRVFGHIALWDSCHTGFAGQCVQPSRSPSNYAYFHVGEVETAEGECLSVGKLMISGKHAPLHLARQEASKHYDDHARVGAYLRARDGTHGIWVAGSVRPGLSEEQVSELRANPPSGDWRPVNRQLDMVAVLSVPVPGFPVPRVGITASGDHSEVDSLIATVEEFDLSPVVQSAMMDAGLVPLTIDALAALAV